MEKIKWSQQYFDTLSPMEHAVNNTWFETMLEFLKDDGVLYVPVLDKTFNKDGQELLSIIQGGKKDV